jgi:hypothetical protein
MVESTSPWQSQVAPQEQMYSIDEKFLEETMKQF